MPFSPFFTKRPNWFHVRKPAAELAFGFLRSDEHDIVQAVVVEASDGFEIAGERFTAACVEGSDEMLGGLFCDFLDLF
jgi:hypothetical protein